MDPLILTMSLTTANSEPVAPAALPDEQLADELHRNDATLLVHAQELAALEREVLLVQRRQADLREETASRQGMSNSAFREKWNALLNPSADRPDRHDRLYEALEEFTDEQRRRFLHVWGMRPDNHQSLLMLYGHQRADTKERIYLALLALLPLLVNEDNPNVGEQAARLNVRVPDKSDSEAFYLVAHPRLHRYELRHLWLNEDTVEFSGNTLREVVDYICEHRAYYEE